MGKHRSMSSTAHNVVLVQSFIKRNGLGEPLHSISNALLKSTAP